MKRVLVISRNAWSNRISTGNTLTNFYNGWDADAIANVYCRAETIDNQVCDKYYRITESDLLNYICRKEPAGKKIYKNSKIDGKELEVQASSSKMYGFFRNHKFVIALWAREMLWAIGGWKNNNLRNFLLDFQPDIIYMPIYDCFYMHNLLAYCWSITKAKVVLFTGDDMYSLKQFSLSPLFWINRLILRSKIRHSVELSSKCYCLMSDQAVEYEKYFGKKFFILIKEISDQNLQHGWRKNHDGLLVVYTGNIDKGRFNTICNIADAVDKIESTDIRFEIYSGSTLTHEMERRISCYSKTVLCGEITPAEVMRKQKEADIVVHVEPFGIRERLKNRLSFSTKIVDYMSNRCCILAVGWGGAASIKYLKNNKLACTVTKLSGIGSALGELLDQSKRDSYAETAYRFACANHKPGTNFSTLNNDFDLL